MANRNQILDLMVIKSWKERSFLDFLTRPRLKPNFGLSRPKSRPREGNQEDKKVREEIEKNKKKSRKKQEKTKFKAIPRYFLAYFDLSSYFEGMTIIP